MKFLAVLIGFTLSLASAGQAAEVNLVANGSFAQSQRQAGVPDDWSTAGHPAIKQRLTIAPGRDGGPGAQLECTEFTGDGPDAHAMICQVGKVALRSGRWYRLIFWAKGAGLRAGAVDVALSDMRRWENAGLAEVFTPEAEWTAYEFLFHAKGDLPATASRLQFWFKGTGTLWLADVVLAESADGPQWFPQIVAAPGGKNLVPNSSFECGPANWGGFTYGLGGWSGNLYRLEGVCDDTVAAHGRYSLKIALTPTTLPVYSFDYYEPVRQPVRRVLAANRGWFHVTPGVPLTLSAFLRADAEGTVAQLVVNEAPGRLQRKTVTVGREWRRYEFTFAPAQTFLFIAVGLDLEASARGAATLWLDAVQLERGDHATVYAPRQPVESFIATGSPDNIGTDAAAGLAFTVRAFNDSDRPQTVNGKFLLMDFFDRAVGERTPTLTVPAHADAQVAMAGLGRGQDGFFRATWTAPAQAATPALRCAIVTPVDRAAIDSPLGFNHAYPWDFLVRLARQAGIVWWRDWPAKWQTVEPEPGRFDFTAADAQIGRVLGLECAVEVLLPFPSAAWSTTARADEVAKAAGGNNSLQARLPLAYAPKNLEDFGRYAAAVARHYHSDQPRAVTHFQILNEPVYTDYALPRKFGYTLADYLRLLAVAGPALHAAAPECRVVGGISANLDAALTREFVTGSGLRLLDVFDLHLYDSARPAESFDEPFAALAALMRANGGPKPVWITEWGCYADDDPACRPYTVGDSTMNRCRWPSERAAAEHIVRFTAVSFAHGVRKIFFHAGTCGPINGPDAGGVLFTYGGAPRKMYAAVAPLTRLLGVPDECVRQLHADGMHAYVFRTQGRFTAIAWCETGRTRPLQLAPRVEAFDIMGNPLAGRDPVLASSPIYLVAAQAEALVAALER